MKTLIGMIHLKPLPGSPGWAFDLDAIRDAALRDAEALAKGGVDAIMIENFGDTPFFKDNLPPVTVAAMSVLADAVGRAVDVPIGINCLRNDGAAALSIAAMVGAAFVRVNVLTGARVTDQGVIEGRAAELLRMRTSFNLDPTVQILADVDVKHSAPLALRPIEEEVGDMVERGGADGLIISGSGTGKPADPDMARRVKAVAPKTPLYVGSGINEASIGSFVDHVDGFIVGTYFKVDGKVDAPVDVERVKRLVGKLNASTGGSANGPRKVQKRDKSRR
ncbi:MAG TPA: BtpA/SgcQ family protein [Tepidisphaeraceae bacterium]|nr:BtpA/SgcQ family protein [Tepidisphaeraceae bacterium]